MTIKTLYPAIQPTLSLDFAKSKTVDPRITFTRTGTAAYYDGKTTVKAEENLLTYSQEFDNAAWTKGSVTVTANTGVAPDGTSTADTVTFPSGGVLEQLRAAISFSSGVTYTISIYARSISGNTSFSFDLTNVETQAFTLTPSWARYTWTVTPAAARTWLDFQLGGAGAIEIWGAQLEQRSTVTAYTPTTTQAITNYIPAIQYAPANTPRIDFDPITGECKGLLIEEQRTNLLTYSGSVGGTNYTFSNISVTANSAVAPDGTQTVSNIVVSTAAGGHSSSQQAAVTTAGTYTSSCYIKANTYRYIVVGILFDGNANRLAVVFDALTGSFVSTTGVQGTASAGSYTITPAGNGWFRVSVTATTPTMAVGPLFRIWNPSNNSAFNETSSYAGDGYSGIYIWGAQLEAGAFPTSYIPTVASQVTRGADSASMTGVNYTSWLSQSEGTFYEEFSFATTAVARYALSGSNFANMRWLYGNATSSQLNMYDGTNAVVLGTASAVVFNKAAVFSTQTLMGGSLNGAAVVSGVTNGTLLRNSTSILIGDGNERLNGHIKKLSYYPKRLSNSELQALTA